MERLTKRNEDGYVVSAIDCPNGRKYLSCSMVEGYSCDHQCEADVMCKLADYEDLEEKGLLPKFHLGDEFWTVRCREILKSKIVMLQQKKDGTWRYRFNQEISPKYHDTHDYEEMDFGKYFFDTKEEAEKLAEKYKKQWEEELKRLEEKRNNLENK